MEDAVIKGLIFGVMVVVFYALIRLRQPPLLATEIFFFVAALPGILSGLNAMCIRTIAHTRLAAEQQVLPELVPGLVRRVRRLEADHHRHARDVTTL